MSSNTGNDPDNYNGARLRLLSIVLDRLLPPNGELPGAGSLGLGGHIAREANAAAGHEVALNAVLDALPASFLELIDDEQSSVMREVEVQVPEAFSVLVLMAYNAYYTDQRVLDQIERDLGYEARPPQPLGYKLKPFDEGALAEMRARKPFWRQVDNIETAVKATAAESTEGNWQT